MKSLVQFLLEEKEKNQENKNILKQLGIDNIEELFKVTKKDIEDLDNNLDDVEDELKKDITSDDADDDEDDEKIDLKEADSRADREYHKKVEKLSKIQLRNVGGVIGAAATGIIFPPAGAICAAAATMHAITAIGTSGYGIALTAKYKKLKYFEENDENNLIKANAMLATAAKKEKDPEKKEKLMKQAALINYSLYDKNGKKRNVEDQYKMLKDTLGKEGIKGLSNAVDDDAVKAAMDSEYMKGLNKKIKKIKPEEWEKYDKEVAKKVKENIEKQKQEKEKEKEEGDVKKDEDGNILKKEVVTDPETGKKKKVVTHTGPRGGKFYYPEGKPKNDEHKVYVQK